MSNPDINKVITEQEAEELGLESRGDCYARAAQFLFEFPPFETNKPVELFLCHGRPRSTNPHPALENRPFEHAWVEFRPTADAPMRCLDGVSMEAEELADFRQQLVAQQIPEELIEHLVASAETRVLILEQEEYYELGRIDPNTVRRYTRTQTLCEMAKSMTYGPWEDAPPANLN